MGPIQSLVMAIILGTIFIVSTYSIIRDRRRKARAGTDKPPDHTT
jgi:hypothetical protein